MDVDNINASSERKLTLCGMRRNESRLSIRPPSVGVWFLLSVILVLVLSPRDALNHRGGEWGVGPLLTEASSLPASADAFVLNGWWGSDEEEEDASSGLDSQQHGFSTTTIGTTANVQAGGAVAAAKDEPVHVVSSKCQPYRLRVYEGHVVGKGAEEQIDVDTSVGFSFNVRLGRALDTYEHTDMTLSLSCPPNINISHQESRHTEEVFFSWTKAAGTGSHWQLTKQSPSSSSSSLSLKAGIMSPGSSCETHSWLSVFADMVAEEKDQLSIVVVDDTARGSTYHAHLSPYTAALCSCTASLVTGPIASTLTSASASASVSIPLSSLSAASSPSSSVIRFDALTSRTLELFHIPQLRTVAERRRTGHVSAPLKGGRKPLQEQKEGDGHAVDAGAAEKTHREQAATSNGTAAATNVQELFQSFLELKPYESDDFSNFMMENTDIGITDREEFLETGKRKNPKLIDKSMEAGFQLYSAHGNLALEHYMKPTYRAAKSTAKTASSSSSSSWWNAEADSIFLEQGASITAAASPASTSMSTSSSSQKPPLLKTKLDLAEDEVVLMEMKAAAFTQARHSASIATGWVIGAILEGIAPEAVNKGQRMFTDIMEQNVIPIVVDIMGGKEPDGGAGPTGLGTGYGILCNTYGENLKSISEKVAVKLVAELTVQIANDVHNSLIQQIKEPLTVQTVDKSTKAALTFVPPALDKIVPSALHRLLPTALLRSLSFTVTQTVTRAVTHGLTSTLMHSLSTNPQLEGACYRCHYYGQMCEWCYNGDKLRTKKYVRGYYSRFYSAYYGDYYADYYTSPEYGAVKDDGTLRGPEPTDRPGGDEGMAPPAAPPA